MKKGFTLIELLVLIAIIGIISSFVLSFLADDEKLGSVPQGEIETGWSSNAQ